MSQHVDIVRQAATYTRVDYTALRAYCLRIPVPIIAKTYYQEESEQVRQGLDKFLQTMRADLLERAIDHNPKLAEGLKHVRHGGHISAGTLKLLIEFADLVPPSPSRTDYLSRWFKIKLVTALKSEDIHTVGELIHAIQTRGAGWWRSIPRIGALRAKVLTEWLLAHERALGPIRIDLTTPAHPAPALILDPGKPGQLAPLGRFGVPQQLDGALGTNRNARFPFIAAQNDLQAVQAYLLRYRDQPHTLRAYTRELERLLLWAILIAKKPMSSLLADDFERYKDFLKSPDQSFKGPRAPRYSPRWKPFAESTKGLSAKSQRYAFSVVTSLFEWLCKIRYLAGNPHAAVKPPQVVSGRKALKVEKAFPDKLWSTLIHELTDLCQRREHSQQRIALAAMLLMGDSGLRRHEAVATSRADLQIHGKIALLNVIGKGNKERVVPVSPRTLRALQAHWVDRGIDPDSHGNQPLLAPLIIPGTVTSQYKHAQHGGYKGYSADGLYRLIKNVLKVLACQLYTYGKISEADALLLRGAGAHAFRHTFGTLSVAHKMPLDVAQKILGHASLSTTSIYVNSEQERVLQEAAAYYEKNA